MSDLRTRSPLKGPAIVATSDEALQEVVLGLAEHVAAQAQELEVARRSVEEAQRAMRGAEERAAPAWGSTRNRSAYPLGVPFDDRHGPTRQMAESTRPARSRSGTWLMSAPFSNCRCTIR